MGIHRAPAGQGCLRLFLALLAIGAALFVVVSCCLFIWGQR